jgi:hypothetical protein
VCIIQLKDFYLTVAKSEENATAFLREHSLLSLLDTVEETLPCHKCGSEMVNARKRDRGGDFRPVFRCKKKKDVRPRVVYDGRTNFFITRT